MDYDRSFELMDILKNSRKLITRPTIRLWVVEFRLLRESLGDDHHKIDLCLVYLQKDIKRLGNDYRFPPVYSPKSFRRHFFWLDEARIKKEQSNPELTVTDESKNIATIVGQTYKWYGDARTQLPLLVQLIINNYVPFRRKLKGINNPLSRIVQSKFPADPKDFVISWIRDVVNKKIGFDDWKGQSIYKWAFTPQHPEFKKKLNQWATEYGNFKLADQFIKELQ